MDRSRPIAFGLGWFGIALLPTSSIIPFGEVMNNHRMFLPFIGLSLAVVHLMAISLERLRPAHRLARGAVAMGGGLILAGYAQGAILRNEVWKTEETLWYDTIQKSPRNGRALMNYGLTQMEQGRYARALDYFTRAHALTPRYSTLQINLGVVHGVMGNQSQAEIHFRQAIEFAPQMPQPYLFYARWLDRWGRVDEALSILRRCIERQPAFLEARHLLLEVLQKGGRWMELAAAVQDTLRVLPTDAKALAYSKLREQLLDQVRGQEKLAKELQTPEAYLDLSLYQYQTGEFEKCEGSSRQAIRLRAEFELAWNNLASCLSAMGRWDEAIMAAGEALRIRPDFQLARNNYLYAIEGKRRTDPSGGGH
jgi:tetratricopeptide (TPR) repeat protein